MDQTRMPLLEALKRHAELKRVSMHVPGHKNGQVFHKDAEVFFKDILTLDVTEIEGMDDLHQPEGIILEAEILAALLFRAAETLFLVGGSTAGNLAMILGTLNEGDRVLVQRSSHQSVLHGLEMAGASPVFLEPERDSKTGITYGVSEATVREAVSAWPEAKALLLTSVSYEGYGQDLTGHVHFAHEAGMCVLVDEAHGPHLIFNQDRWPASALRAGADAVVQSAHKMLPAMTMSSWLHVQGNRVNRNRIKKYLRMLQSSSPSYPLMASLDAARAYLAAYTETQGEQMAEWSRQFRDRLNRIPQICTASEKINGFVQDPLKVVIESRCRASGRELQKAFAEEGIIAELAGHRHVLFTLPFTVSEPEYEAAAAAVQRACSPYAVSPDPHTVHGRKFNSEKRRITPLALSYREMDRQVPQKVPFIEAAGLIAAEDVVPYPPGIPFILKGETISYEQVEELKELVSKGVSFQSGRGFITEGLSVYPGRGENKDI
ncbi:aminotransferase class I/II-fold pyridoxal phosphate-dependent enzyme [Alteribacter lacisalsi]|nr:aminotransferase class I/II-fold pyridoxal phosphate-dependent enzyme [Alteribacter lacisalsi]